MTDTIKEYLVSLGFEVDPASYAKIINSLGNTEKAVTQLTGKTITGFVKSQAAILSFVAASNVAIAAFIGSLAKADLENSKLALSLWTTKENAMAYNNTMKAMGVTLQDLFMSPELSGYFQQLQGQARNMSAPAELNQQLKFIRSIQFEFARMKLESTYALQWIGYYFIKYMDGPIKNIKLSLSSINDIMTKTMPTWTKTIAEVISWFARMGIDTVRAIGDIKDAFDKVSTLVPSKVKQIGLAVAALALLFSTGPVGMFIAAVGGAILLLDDFYTYIDGGDSKLSKFWDKAIAVFKDVKAWLQKIKDKVNEFYKELEKNDSINKWKNNLENAKTEIIKHFKKMEDGVISFYYSLEDNGTVKKFENTFNNARDIIVKAFGMMSDVVAAFYKSIDSDKSMNNFLDNLREIVKQISNFTDGLTGLIDKILGKDGTKHAIETMAATLLDDAAGPFKGFIEFLMTATKLLGTLGLAMQGDFKGALAELKSIGNIYFPPTPTQTPAPTPTSTYHYVQPGAGTTQTKNSNVSISPTYNIYGSEPKQTAKAANDNLGNIYRAFKGFH